MALSRKYSTTESVLLLASEDVQDYPNYKDSSYESLLEAGGQPRVLPETGEVPEVSILSIPNIFQIETSLLLNVLLAAFDGTVTASTYTIIGSEFEAAQLGSWITTSYLITSTAFQPLYGSFSDVLGRRVCYFFATIVFSIGCLGCSISRNIFQLFFARALTGIGGGGLITLATVINSDIIPASKRGLFQGFQNILIGVGSILGAALGGFIAENVGWRFCFLAQVPISSLGLAFGYFYIQNQDELNSNSRGLKDIDFQGSLLLVTGLTFQLLALYTTGYMCWSLGAISIIILVYFINVEIKTERIPIIPFRKIKNITDYIALFISTLTGFANFAYIFILPLLFQIVLGDTPSKAGLRLGIPSLFTSVGSLITAFYMNKDVRNLNYLVHGGVLLLLLGNALALLISKSFPERLLNFLLIPANTGLGMSNPALLFTFVFSLPKTMQASSTSTLYLFRAIGQVWGVALISTIIQSILKWQLEFNFENSGLNLPEDEINDIIEKVIRSLSYIRDLEPNLKSIVSKSYETSIRDAQFISTLICVLCFFLCLVRDYSLKRQKDKSNSV